MRGSGRKTQNTKQNVEFKELIRLKENYLKNRDSIAARFYWFLNNERSIKLTELDFSFMIANSRPIHIYSDSRLINGVEENQQK